MLSRSCQHQGLPCLWRSNRHLASIHRTGDLESAEKARKALEAMDQPTPPTKSQKEPSPNFLQAAGFLIPHKVVVLPNPLKRSRELTKKEFRRLPNLSLDKATAKAEDESADKDQDPEEGEDIGMLRLRLAGMASVAAVILLAALVYTPDIKKAVAIAAALKKQLQDPSQGDKLETVEINIANMRPGEYIQTLAGTAIEGEDAEEKKSTKTAAKQSSENSSNNSGSSSAQKKSADQGGRGASGEEYYQSLGEESGMMVFSGSANVELAREVCAHLNMSLGRMKITRFADGEVSLDILDDVRSRDVYVFQSVPNASTGLSLHSHVMELFLTISALRRASAERITAVLPYMAYSRQEHIDNHHARPLAVCDMARIIHTLGVDRVVFVDLHAPRAVAFFPEPIPVTNLLPQSLAIRYLNKKNLKAPVIVATENTAGERAKLFWSRLKKVRPDVGLATVVSNRPDRVRPSAEIASSITTPGRFKSRSTEPAFPSGCNKTYFVGDVEGRDCIIVDDIIDTGVRASNAVRACKAAGARRIFIYASHGVLSEGAVARLDKCEAEEVLLTNTIEIPSNVVSNKLKILNISKLLAEVVKRLHAETATEFDASVKLGALYRDPDYDTEQLKTAHSQ